MAFDSTIRERPPTDLAERWQTKDVTLRATHFTEYSRPTSWSTCLGRVALVAGKAIATVALSPFILGARALSGTNDACNRFAQWHDKNGIKSTLAKGINNEVALVPKSARECDQIVAAEKTELRFSQATIEEDIEGGKYDKSSDGKYLIRVVPKASGFIFIPLDEEGQPQVAKARQVTLFNADDHTAFADKDTILLHAVDYLNYWDHLADKGMSTDALFIMNLADGTAHGYKRMPGHSIELDNVADANTNYGNILAKDVQKAIQNRHATEQGQAKKREIPKLETYNPDPISKLKKRVKKPTSTPYQLGTSFPGGSGGQGAQVTTLSDDDEPLPSTSSSAGAAATRGSGKSAPKVKFASDDAPLSPVTSTKSASTSSSTGAAATVGSGASASKVTSVSEDEDDDAPLSPVTRTKSASTSSSAGAAATVDSGASASKATLVLENNGALLSSATSTSSSTGAAATAED